MEKQMEWGEMIWRLGALKDFCSCKPRYLELLNPITHMTLQVGCAILLFGVRQLRA